MSRRRPSPAPAAAPPRTLPAGTVPRLLAPLLLATAIALSSLLETPRPPVALAPGAPPPPDAARVQRAYARALEPAGPGHDFGRTNATVTVLEFSDFGCRYSERFATTAYPELAAFVRAGAVRWKYVPFALGMFPNGAAAAAAAECAADQGAAGFRRMHELLFATPREWRDARDPAPVFRTYAREARLDGARFAACLTSDSARARVRASSALADEMGVAATPTFFINGRRIEGALPAAEFRALLEDAVR